MNLTVFFTSDLPTRQTIGNGCVVYYMLVLDTLSPGYCSQLIITNGPFEYANDNSLCVQCTDNSYNHAVEAHCYVAVKADTQQNIDNNLIIFCTQLTKAYEVETSRNQVAIDSATYLLKISLPLQL